MTTSRAHVAPIRPAPSLVLFDLDDTLCDYASARALRLRVAFSRAIEAAGGRPGDHDLDALIAESVAIHPHGADHFGDLLARHGVAGAEAGAVAREWYRTNRFHGLALFADALETLARVRAARPERRIGLVTNGPSEVQRAKVALLGVEPHVDFILISEEFGAAKPEPAIFAEALRLGRAGPAETVFVGDSAEFDMAGAIGSGLRAIWVNRTGSPWTAPGPAPDLVVHDLATVRALLGCSG